MTTRLRRMGCRGAAFSLLLLLSACSDQPQDEVSAIDSGPASAAENQPAESYIGRVYAPNEVQQPPESYQLQEVEITLTRTECFGTCPAYDVTIFGDGRIVYEGRRFVRIEGEQQAVIDTSEVINLLRRFYEIYFFDMRDEYQIAPAVLEQNGLVEVSRSGVSDMPSQTVSIKLGAYEKTIYHYFGGPPDLKALIELIDEVADSKRWIE